MNRLPPHILAALMLFVVAACAAPEQRLRQADGVASAIISEKQLQALGHAEPFGVERPSDTLRRRLLLDQLLPLAHRASLGSEELDPPPHWPKTGYFDSRPQTSLPTLSADTPLRLSLLEALQVAAANSRAYQGAKEGVFRSALVLDNQRNSFRTLLAAGGDGEFSADLGGTSAVRGVTGSGELSARRALQSGAELSSRLVFDVVKLLSGERSSSQGLLADASIAIPLLRGAGRHIAAEPLVQAERDVIYSIWEFERFKSNFAVEVARDYLAVLRQFDQVANSEDNYRRLISSSRRARRLADAGRLPELQVDQALQDELRARDRWVSALQGYEQALDRFKLSLGLPADARIELERAELERLGEAVRPLLAEAQEQVGPRQPPVPPADAPIVPRAPGSGQPGPFEVGEETALALALEHRLDLRVSAARIEDAQRAVVVAADALRAELTLLGRAQFGERRALGGAAREDARLRPDQGFYSALLSIDLPLERTLERNAFRNSYLLLEESVRNLQALEDQVKFEVRGRLRELLEAREGLQIQAQAVRVAQRRVAAANLFLQAGRAEIRDLLEAQEALVSAQNALTAALVNYRVAELELQRDMGVLQVDEQGIWTELHPEELGHERS